MQSTQLKSESILQSLLPEDAKTDVLSYFVLSIIAEAVWFSDHDQCWGLKVSRVVWDCLPMQLHVAFPSLPAGLVIIVTTVNVKYSTQGTCFNMHFFPSNLRWLLNPNVTAHCGWLEFHFPLGIPFKVKDITKSKSWNPISDVNNRLTLSVFYIYNIVC